MRTIHISVPELKDITNAAKSMKTKAAQTIGTSLFIAQTAYQSAKLARMLAKAEKED